MAVTIQEILTQINLAIGHLTETPALDAQVLVANFLNKPRPWVLAHPEALVNAYQHEKIIKGLDRLVLGEPLPYVIGHWEFFGIDLYLTPDVLIPRPETELLVERGITWLQNHPNRRIAIDVGTGSGCIGIALAMNISNLRVLMTDISPDALKVARINAEKFGISDRLEFRQTDLLDGITAQYDLICANLPYIPRQVLRNLPVAESEPLLALDGGQSGTEHICRLLDQARQCLSPGGLMLLEIEASQGAEVKTIAHSFYPSADLEVRKDHSGLDRCIEVIRPNLIVHLCHTKEWQEAQKQGIFLSPSLQTEGFIHCSQPEQILSVANRFYKGISELSLLWIDPQKIISEIHWDSVDGEPYPHIYGSINLDAVISVRDINPDDDGTFRVLQSPD